MKKFTDINRTFESKKYTEKSKNEIYDLIKENIHISIEGEILEGDVNIDLKGVKELVEKINEYINNVKIQEKVNTLKEIKNIAATGTLSFERINEEIESCECSETCPEGFKEEDEKESEKDTTQTEF